MQIRFRPDADPVQTRCRSARSDDRALLKLARLQPSGWPAWPSRCILRCRRATSPVAALYFVLAICVGTYLILNLFLAILLDNFSRQARDLHDSARVLFDSARFRNAVRRATARPSYMAEFFLCLD